MKQLVYGLLALAAVPVIAFTSDPLENDLPFVAVANTLEQELDDSELDEAIEEADDPSDVEDTNLVSSPKPKGITKQERQELDTWKGALETQDRNLFRKLVKKRKIKRPEAPPLNKSRAEKLLARAKARIEQRKKNKAQESREETSNSLDN